MLINFSLKNKEFETTFKALGKLVGNTLVFPDRSLKNTILEVEINDNYISLKRHGETTMSQDFILHKLIKGSYENNMGISLEIKALTQEMTIIPGEINIVYDFYIANDLQSTNKLIIKY